MSAYQLNTQYIIQSMTITLDVGQIQALAKTRGIIEDMLTAYAAANPGDTRTLLLQPLRDLIQFIADATEKASGFQPAKKLTGGAAAKIIREREAAARQSPQQSGEGRQAP